MREKEGRTYVRGPPPEPKEGTRGYKQPKKLVDDDIATCHALFESKYADYVANPKVDFRQLDEDLRHN